jgi:Carboxypeptidase regulatory-like domain
MAGLIHQSNDPLGRVGPVDGHAGTDDSLDVSWRRHDDAHQRSGFLIPSERSVVDPDNADVPLRQGTPQRYDPLRGFPTSMSATTVRIRCLRCGTEIAASAGPSSATKWIACPHCQAPVPIVAPTDPPPLFSWEVYPHLYPPLPPPRFPRHSARGAAGFGLVIATLLLVGVAGGLLYEGSAAMTPAHFTVGGTVYESASGTAGSGLVTVALYGENGFTERILTEAGGSFSFSEVPQGGASLNVSAPGYAPVNVSLFLSVVYVAGGSTTAIVVTLTPGSEANATDVDVSPFANMESFVANIWSGAFLLLIAAALTAVGAVATFRTDRPPLGAAGGFATLVAPIGLILLGATIAFSWVGWLCAGLAAVGAFVALVRIVPMIQAGHAADLD